MWVLLCYCFLANLKHDSIKVGKDTHEIPALIDEYADIMMKEFSHGLLPIRENSHFMDLILGSILFNKATYRMILLENEEIDQHV